MATICVNFSFKISVEIRLWIVNAVEYKSISLFFLNAHIIMNIKRCQMWTTQTLYTRFPSRSSIPSLWIYNLRNVLRKFCQIWCKHPLLTNNLIGIVKCEVCKPSNKYVIKGRPLWRSSSLWLFTLNIKFWGSKWCCKHICILQTGKIEIHFLCFATL